MLNRLSFTWDKCLTSCLLAVKELLRNLAESSFVPIFMCGRVEGKALTSVEETRDKELLN